ncbi:MAG: DsbA family oxidoreductase [Bacteroidota bacterium]
MNLFKCFLILFLSCLMMEKPAYAQGKLKSNTKIKTMNSTDSLMKVEVWSDVMCPFCYIGKRKFEQALAQFPAKEKVQLVWKSYQLDPSISAADDKDYVRHLQQKKGWSDKQTKEILDNVTQMAAEVGLDYHFEKAMVANSFKAHRFAHYAGKFGLQDSAEEALFIGHFVEGKDISDNETLAAMGEAIGLNRQNVVNFLSTDEMIKDVNQDIQEAEQIGVTGVPFFVFDRKYAISGAQDEKVFLNTLEKSFREWEKLHAETKLELIEGKSCKPNGECE